MSVGLILNGGLHSTGGQRATLRAKLATQGKKGQPGPMVILKPFGFGLQKYQI